MARRNDKGVFELPEEMYKRDAHFVIIDRHRIPISIDHCWSAFDDYLDFQTRLARHEDTRLEPGPANGPGAIISFKYQGTRTYETLLIKDDCKKIWKINIPRPNETFSFYEATIKLLEGETEGEQEIEAQLDGVLIEKDDEKRKSLINQLAAVGLNGRIREIVDVVLERDGLRQKHEFIIKCPLEDLWKVVGNWNDVSWVVGATGVELHTGFLNPTRTIKLENGGEVFEYQKELSDEDHKLIYVVERSTGINPIQLYKGTLQLETPCAKPGTVNVKYDIVFIPKEGIKPDVALEALDKDMKRRFAFLQKQFGK